MKSYLILFTTLFLLPAIAAQSQEPAAIKSGKIIYTEKVKIEIKLEGENSSQIASILPKEKITEKVLLFSKDATLYQDGNNPDDDLMQQEEAGVKIKMTVSGQGKLYTDLKNKSVIDQRDFMNRIFLIEKPVTDQNWKITGQQKTILGYACMEAEKTDTTGKKTIVWFSPNINVSSGPAGLGNLPGVILEADINNGSRTYIAKNVQEIPEADLKIARPKEGRKVTDSEYKAIVEEKMKESGVQSHNSGEGGSHVNMIIIKR